MKAAIVGYGNMGKEIEKVLKSRKHEIVAIIDPSESNTTHKTITAEALRDAEVVFEFTHPSQAVKNIEAIAALGKNVVVGTTGWHDQIKNVENAVLKNNIALIYGTNFSLGVNMFYRIVETAADLVNKTEEYDVYGMEMHHVGKADSPSGTAKSIAEILLNNIRRKKRVVYDKLDKKIAPDEIHFTSVRAGSLPGTHIVGFDSKQDKIELRHDAKGREGFALGAVLAGEWLAGKRGLFTVSDFMNKYFR
ncbi:MAG TPA: 4-hydroxy-tetrahydrodipicolinate reductase [Candidatus Nanoarchaeia archaeon]|nr:4-hydroxy-tetrahydrodipicolinate reductase [Candidatus Nanoarchaeia archaeon]